MDDGVHFVLSLLKPQKQSLDELFGIFRGMKYWELSKRSLVGKLGNYTRDGSMMIRGGGNEARTKYKPSQNVRCDFSKT